MFFTVAKRATEQVVGVHVEVGLGGGVSACRWGVGMGLNRPMCRGAHCHRGEVLERAQVIGARWDNGKYLHNILA